VSITRFVAAVALSVVVSGCGSRDDATRTSSPEPDESLVVYAVNEPLRYFAERIGGSAVRAVMPAPTGVDPADWWPGAAVVGDYQRADLILLNGAGYAAWVSRASLPRAALVDTSRGFTDRLIPTSGEVAHRHGPEGEHSHGSYASTFWLDPELAGLQARAIADALVAKRPAAAEDFERAFAALAADLRALDDDQRRVAEQLSATGLAFSHPVYPYWQRRYGLSGPSMHWEPEAAPDSAQWRAFERLVAEESLELMLWEARPRADTRAQLEELGIEALVYSAGGGATAGTNWLDQIRENVKRLETVAGSSFGGG
jgi:zinc transport system substrate-binding protein